MSEEGQIQSISPLDLQGTYDATAIVERSLMGGYGGVEALNQYLQALPYIGEIHLLRSKIATNNLRYNRALRQTEEKRIQKLTLFVQEHEAMDLLGEDEYYRTEDEMLKLGIDDLKVRPVTITLYKAFDWLTTSYLAAYEAIGRCMSYMAEAMGWGRYIIDDPDFAMYLSRLFHGSIKGDTRVSAEERGIMQFIVLGNYAQVDQKKAEELIRIGGQVLKWGYISETYDGYFFPFYKEANLKWSILFSQLTAGALPQLLASLWQPANITFQITATADLKPYWFPFFIDNESSWESGKIRGTIALEPLEDFPAFVTQTGGAVTGIFGPPGSGKTIALDAILAYSVFKRRNLVWITVSDDTNQIDRCVIPLISINDNSKDITNRTLANLRQWGIKPQGIPRLTLNIVTPETKSELEEVCLTKYDAIVEIADPKNFTFDSKQMKKILKKLKEKAEYPEFQGMFSDKKPVGVINVRRLDATIIKRRVNHVDVQIGQRLLDIIDKWRYHNMNMPMRIQVDEIADLAPSIVRTGGAQDLLAMTVTLEKILRRHRRKDLPIDWATQRPVQIITELRDAVTNVLFRDLVQALKAEQSQLDFLSASLQTERDESIEAMKSIMKRGYLRGNHLMFWYSRRDRSINMVQAVPPPFAVEIKGLSEEEHYKIWVKKHNGPKDLFKKLEEVEVLFKADETISEEVVEEEELGEDTPKILGTYHE